MIKELMCRYFCVGIKMLKGFAVPLLTVVNQVKIKFIISVTVEDY